jgi:hypothetical protein
MTNRERVRTRREAHARKERKNMRPAIAAITAIALVTFLSLSPPATHAAMYNGGATINEAQALSTCNPNPAPAGGGGAAGLTYDSATNMLTWNISFSNLSGAPTAAHFHGPAMPGVDAGIQVTITDLTSPSEGSATITDAQEADLLAGLYYINYHTTACSGGEVRGQVSMTAASVGGIASLPDAPGDRAQTVNGSGHDSALLAGVGALGAALIALTGAAWYARRRRIS